MYVNLNQKKGYEGHINRHNNQNKYTLLLLHLLHQHTEHLLERRKTFCTCTLDQVSKSKH